MKKIILFGLILVILISGCVNQLLNSGDARCAIQNLKNCGWYNLQANQNLIVEECKDVSINDFCYFESGKITPLQIKITYKPINSVKPLPCNYNLDTSYCDYTEFECTPYRIGFEDTYFCKPHEDDDGCAKRLKVNLCD